MGHAIGNEEIVAGLLYTGEQANVERSIVGLRSQRSSGNTGRHGDDPETIASRCGITSRRIHQIIGKNGRKRKYPYDDEMKLILDYSYTYSPGALGLESLIESDTGIQNPHNRIHQVS